MLVDGECTRCTGILPIVVSSEREDDAVDADGGDPYYDSPF